MEKDAYESPHEISMGTEPEISILVPTYRRPKQLERALSSIFDHQSEDDLSRTQVLIGEDASGSPWNEAYEALWTQLESSCGIFKNNQNVGMAQNLLSLARRAHTNYSMILTDDDTLAPGALREILNLVKRAEAQGAGLIAISRLNISEHGSVRGRSATVFWNGRIRPSSTKALRMTPRAHILTGLVLRTEALVDPCWNWSLDNAYFPMAIQYYAVSSRGAIYSRRSLVYHTVENETHWHRWGSNRDEQTLRLYYDRSQMLGRLFLEALQDTQSRQEQIKIRFIRKAIYIYWTVASFLNESNFTYKEYCLRESKCEDSGSRLSHFTFFMATSIGQLTKRGLSVIRRFRL